MDDAQVDAYLARIGTARPARADEAALRGLQLAHLLAVPFENLSIHLGERIVLEEEALVDKIATRRRGGFCYELNGGFGALLAALGYRVTLLNARVTAGGGLGPPFDHMALRVDLAEPWLVDVGFGKFSHHPLRLNARDDQRDPAGVFRIAESKAGYGDLDVTLDSNPEYRLSIRPYELDAFVPTCWWHQTSPESHFTPSLTCSLLTERGRLTLSGNRLISTADGERDERILGGDAEILAAYRDHFGISLDQVPTVRSGSGSR